MDPVLQPLQFRGDLFRALSLVSEACGFLREDPLGDAELTTVHDEDPAGIVGGAETGIGPGTGYSGGHGDTDCGIACADSFFKISAVVIGRDLAGLGNHVLFFKALIESIRGDRHAVQKLFVSEADLQRDNGDPAAGSVFLGKITGGIGDDADCHIKISYADSDAGCIK